MATPPRNLSQAPLLSCSGQTPYPVGVIYRKDQEGSELLVELRTHAQQLAKATPKNRS